MNNLCFLSVSWTHFRKQPLRMFFKMGALKDFAIFRIKKETQTCFSVNLLFFNNRFFIEHLRWLLLYFLKVIKQLFCKDVLKKCSCYDVLIIFSLIYKKSNLFVYKFFVNCWVFYWKLVCFITQAILLEALFFNKHLCYKL